MIRTKYARDPREPDDATRIYVNRFIQRWERKRSDGTFGPRSFDYDEIYQFLGPSPGLHADIANERIPWKEYDRRYRVEMNGHRQRAKIVELAGRFTGGQTLTPLCKHPKASPTPPTSAKAT